MSLNTTKTGLQVLDKAFGGIYMNRPTLISGRRKSGKAVFSAHLILKTLQLGEKVVLFTDKTPDDIIHGQDVNDQSLREAVASEQLIIYSYHAMGIVGDCNHYQLPFPQALDELTEIVREKRVSYAIFDTIVPWVAVQPEAEMPGHIEKLIAAFNNLDLTTLLLLPEPVSPAAKKVARILKELCPINFELESRNFGAEFILRVTKYQGKAKAKLPVEFCLDIVPGSGFTTASPAEQSASEDAEVAEASPTVPYSAAPAQRKFKPLVAGSMSDISSVASDSQFFRNGNQDSMTVPGLPPKRSIPSFAAAINTQTKSAFPVSAPLSGDDAATSAPAPVLADEKTSKIKFSTVIQ